MSKILQDINIGSNLKKIRKERKMTQSDVCAQMSVRGRPMVQATLGHIERGRRNIFASDLIVLKQILQTSYDSIFDGLEPVNKYQQDQK